MKPSAILPLALVCASITSGASCARGRVGARAAEPLDHAESGQNVSPRELLAAQPDFVAYESCTSVEGAHGHGLGLRVAKKGRWYRRETDIVAAFSSAEEPYLRYLLKAKIFDTPETMRRRRAWFENAANAAVLAAQMLALKHDDIRTRYEDYRRELSQG